MSTEKMELPSEDWIGFFKNHFGPSMMWALLGIGSSHIVLAPTFGASFGLFAIWAISFIFLVKYGAWALGIRYNYTVGKDLIAGYKDLPGPGNWALWASAFVVLIAVVLNTAAVGMAGAAVVAALSSVGQLGAFIVIVVVSTLLVAGTNYTFLERFLFLFIVLFVFLMVLSLLVGLPSMAVVTETTFAVPALLESPFLPVFAAAAGLTPTLINSSLFLSSWSLTKNQGARHDDVEDSQASEYEDYISAWLKTGLKDFRIGYLLSYLLMVILATLAASVLYPGLPEGDIAAALGEIFGESFGQWAFYVMMVGAFAALWSTVIASLDGGARVFVNILSELEIDVAPDRTRRLLVVLFALLSAVPVVVLGQTPTVLIVAFGTAGLLIEVFIYPANLYLVYNHVPEKFRPSSGWLAYYIVAIVCFVGLAVLGGLSQVGIL
ncbi:Nramp family divalent metal transporter [Halococcus hamelinensis]|nr:Nramp family divalent metal transporter [Halococcus hamelinensis]